MLLYKALCVLRVILVLWPQTGYIHPDEHFQGPEIVYGDIGNYDVHRTWEFTSSKPIRSIVFPYFMTAVPAFIVKFSSYFQYTPHAYLLLILPRLFMCLTSFFQDWCLYKICLATKLNHKPCLLFFGSSYVTFAYLTRTFSNALESLYFAILMLLLLQILKLKDLVLKRSTSDVYVTRYIYYSFIFSIILFWGFYNRPTFICFSAFPTLIWCYMSFQMNIRIKLFIAFLLGTLSINVFLVAIDTFYYNKIHYSSILNLETFRIIYTPLNFLFYNSNLQNLENHGLHPRWLHLVVNIPLLFSVYGVLLPIYTLKNSFNSIKQFKLSYEFFFLLSFLFPLFLLSLIPHQEPRFLIPLIIPLSLLIGQKNLKSYWLFTCIWIISNYLCVSFYGFTHQAGVYSSIKYLEGKNTSNSVIVFYQTYMPPQYLLALDKTKNTKVFDFTGFREHKFLAKIKDVTIQQKPSNIFIISPVISIDSLKTYENFFEQANYKFGDLAFLFPHLSVENLPENEEIDHFLSTKSSLIAKLQKFQNFFSIQVLVFKKRFKTL